MTDGIERGPVYPDIPEPPLSAAQVESLQTFYAVDEHLDLISTIFELESDEPYRLSADDIEARRFQQDVGRRSAYRRSRTTREIGSVLMATVAQIEDEFRGRSLLDIGCGTGRFGEEMARNAKAKVTFLDSDPESLAMVSKRAGTIVEADGLALPFEDESFQRVTNFFSSVHWAESPLQSAQALNEAVRVTEAGGSTFVAPLMNGLTQRRDLLPILLMERLPDGSFSPEDRYAATWSLQDYCLTQNLYRLAEGGYCGITWKNNVDYLTIAGFRVPRENITVIIDKYKTIPPEVLAENIEQARKLMAEAA